MKKMNNKGFSLVELIIVIAIMAILIVVLAPQYLKYVERSRNSTDMQTATEFMDACEVWAADPYATPGFTANYEFKISNNTSTDPATLTDAGGVVAAALASTGLTVNDFKCQSKTAWTTLEINGVVTSDGTIAWWSTQTDFADKMGLQTSKAAALALVSGSAGGTE